MVDLILTTNWEKVEKDDFYLTKDWEENGGKENLQKAKKLLKENNLFYGYITYAIDYIVSAQMDAQQVLIDRNANIIVECESSTISNNCKDCFPYEY